MYPCLLFSTCRCQRIAQCPCNDSVSLRNPESLRGLRAVSFHGILSDASALGRSGSLAGRNTAWPLAVASVGAAAGGFVCRRAAGGGFLDGAYAKRPFVQPLVQQSVTLVGRLRKDSALFDLPPVETITRPCQTRRLTWSGGTDIRNWNR